MQFANSKGLLEFPGSASRSEKVGSVGKNVASAIEKQELLFARLREIGPVIVAFSGGADSAYLAWAADRALGDRALAVTALSASFSAHDREQASLFLHATNLRHEFIETSEFENPLYVMNGSDRCYHCKSELFSQLKKLRAARGFAAVAYGMNADDQQDFRPGHRAASEFGVVAPLLEVSMHKVEIRELSRVAGLSTWDRPASACLSSRIPYGTAVTAENLLRVERAETVLRDFGFRQFRVRSYGEFASIEIALEELPRAQQTEMAGALTDAVQKVGFASATLDPEGYRQGSLNAALKKK